LILAAQHGNIETFSAFLKAGRDIKEVGHICLSRRKHNSVISNVVGAAAYYGNHKLLKNIILRLGNNNADQINFPCKES